MIFLKSISISAILEVSKSCTFLALFFLDFRAPKSFRRRDFPMFIDFNLLKVKL